MHLSKEALYLFGIAAASPEVDVIPHMAPEKRYGLHQRLHSIKLFTLQAGTDRYICHAMQLREGTNWDEIDLRTN